MAWITPKTNWIYSDRVTADDMNRICGNINYLLGEERLQKVYTEEDYVFLSEWVEIVRAFMLVQVAAGIANPEKPTDAVTSYNFNLIESICLVAKDIIDHKRSQPTAIHYVGEGWRSDSEVYAGGYI